MKVGNKVDFIMSETNRLRKRYPGIKAAPLYYQVENNLLYSIK